MDIAQTTTQNSSYNSRLILSIRQFFLPDKAQIALYALISSILLVLVDSQEIWKKFSNDYLDNAGFGETINLSAPSVSHFIHNLQGSRVPLVIFWGLVGCSAYILIWFVVNIFNNLRNDIIADSYLPDGSTKRALYWESVVFRKVILLLLVALLLAYLFIGFKILPLLGDVFYSSITDFRLLTSSLLIVLTVAGLAFLIHIFIVLVHLTSNSWRLVYRSF